MCFPMIPGNQQENQEDVYKRQFMESYRTRSGVRTKSSIYYLVLDEEAGAVPDVYKRQGPHCTGR